MNPSNHNDSRFQCYLQARGARYRDSSWLATGGLRRISESNSEATAEEPPVVTGESAVSTDDNASPPCL